MLFIRAPCGIVPQACGLCTCLWITLHVRLHLRTNRSQHSILLGNVISFGRNKNPTTGKFGGYMEILIELCDPHNFVVCFLSLHARDSQQAGKKYFLFFVFFLFFLSNHITYPFFFFSIFLYLIIIHLKK